MRQPPPIAQQYDARLRRDEAIAHRSVECGPFGDADFQMLFFEKIASVAEVRKDFADASADLRQEALAPGVKDVIDLARGDLRERERRPYQLLAARQYRLQQVVDDIRAERLDLHGARCVLDGAAVHAHQEIGRDVDRCLL